MGLKYLNKYQSLGVIPRKMPNNYSSKYLKQLSICINKMLHIEISSHKIFWLQNRGKCISWISTYHRPRKKIRLNFS